jgi:hypothetical protein
MHPGMCRIYSCSDRFFSWLRAGPKQVAHRSVACKVASLGLSCAYFMCLSAIALLDRCVGWAVDNAGVDIMGMRLDMIRYRCVALAFVAMHQATALRLLHVVHRTERWQSMSCARCRLPGLHDTTYPRRFRKGLVARRRWVVAAKRAHKQLFKAS